MNVQLSFKAVEPLLELHIVQTQPIGARTEINHSPELYPPNPRSPALDWDPLVRQCVYVLGCLGNRSCP